MIEITLIIEETDVGYQHGIEYDFDLCSDKQENIATANLMQRIVFDTMPVVHKKLDVIYGGGNGVRLAMVDCDDNNIEEILRCLE